MKKASIELSVNFLVKLILAIVVFGFGMTIVRNIFSSAGSGELTQNVDAEVEQQIKILMDTGEKVIMYPEEIITSRNKAAVFGLGILNILEKPQATEYSVEVECYSYIDRSNTENDCSVGSQSGSVDEWTFDAFPPVSLKNNEDTTVGVPILPADAEKGTYIYNARVSYDENGAEKTYGIVKFRVIVD
jgi:hypothetical protein